MLSEIRLISNKPFDDFLKNIPRLNELFDTIIDFGLFYSSIETKEITLYLKPLNKNRSGTTLNMKFRDHVLIGKYAEKPRCIDIEHAKSNL